MDAPKANEADGHVSAELSRDLGLAQVTLMGVGMMIGAGVFLGIGNGLKDAGPGGMMMVFTLNALLAMFSAMSYAELSSAIPRAGGAYNFARVAFGKGPSFLAGWMEWAGSTVAGAMYAWTFSLYVLQFLDAMGWLPWSGEGEFGIRVLAAATATLFAYINYRGASETGKFGAYITVGQTVTLLLVAVLGIWKAISDPARFQNFDPFLNNGWLPIMGTMGMIYVAFEGYEVIAQAGDETIDPRRNLPKAMMLSVVVVGITYIFVSFASVLSVEAGDIKAAGGWEHWVGEDADTLFSRIVGGLLPMANGVFGKILVVLAVIFSSTSALNATTYSATRSAYALGRDRMLPGAMSAISPKTRTPYVALLVTWGLILAIDLFAPSVKDVASMSSMMFLFLFFLVNLCCIRMRRHMGDELNYGYVMPLFPLIPLLAIVGQIVLVFLLREEMSWSAWIIGPAWVVLGVFVYRFYGRSRAVSTRDEIISFDEGERAPKEGFRILMPVANPDSTLAKVPTIMQLATANQAEVELLHMVPVPDQVPLSDAQAYMDPGREAMAEAMLYLRTRFPIHETVRYCRNVARGILSAARTHQADLIVAGWRGRSQRHDFLFGSTIDPLLELNPCDVVVLKDCGKSSYKHILVPFAGGPHALLALRTASTLVNETDGVIVPLNVGTPGKPTIDITAFLEKNRDAFHCPLEKFQPRYEVSREVVETIVNAGQEADLIVVGATGEHRFTQFAVGSLPEALAERCSGAMIMVKAATRVKGFVNRWF
jgi:amino acid transporter/nucleotide-binding universal stress UspA family protein